MTDRRAFAAFFRQYLREHAGCIGVGLAAVLIFAGAFFLYRLPVEAVWYPAALCGCLLLGYTVWHGARAWRRHRQRKQAAKHADLLSAACLPPARTQSETDLYQLIELLAQQQRQTEEDSHRRYTDMVEYYTVWAHQIKTPIASMRLHLQNEDTPFSRQLSTDLLRVEQYVEMVLAFLRLDAASTDYVFQSCDLDAILRESVKKFAGEFIDRHLQLHYAPLCQTVVTDEKWLSFVLEQLLSNALKYTPAGGVSIYWEAPCTLCIRDTGIGIDPADLPRIFEKGYTGYNGRADKAASGIGLYLCRRICHSLGHTLAVTSVPNAGTTVRLDLSQRAFCE